MRATRTLALVMAAGIGIAAPSALAFASPSAQAPKVEALTALKGVTLGPALESLPNFIATTKELGALDGTKQLQLTIWLGLRDSKEANAIGDAVSTPGNKAFHNYLTTKEFKARFAPSTEQVDKVTAWAKANGLALTHVGAANMYLNVTATAATVEKVFKTSLKAYANGLYAPAAAVAIPAALREAGVDGIAGLDNQAALLHPDSVRESKPTTAPTAFANAKPCSAYYSANKTKNVPKAYGKQVYDVDCGNTVLTERKAYDLAPVYKKGITGKGQKIVIVDAYDSATMFSDANQWAKNFHVASLTKSAYDDVSTLLAKNTPEGPGPSSILLDPEGWAGEQTLDVETIHGIAPGAKIVYDGASSATSLDSTLSDAISKHLGNEISDSWGGTGLDSSEESDDSSAFTMAKATGIGVYFSAGDSGDESAGGTTTPAPDDPAADPMVTAVGGTSFELNKKKNGFGLLTGWGTGEATLSNGKWSPSLSKPTYLYGGGGGVNTNDPQPAYQKGSVPKSLSEKYGKSPRRVEPDISTLGDPNTGEVIGNTETFSSGTKYGQYREGGTSLSCPLYAAINSLVSQAHHTEVGFANPAIYKLYKTKNHPGLVDVLPLKHKHAEARYDFTSGTSGATTMTLRIFGDYASLKMLKGYDDVTGVGTPKGLTYINDLLKKPAKKKSKTHKK